MGCRYALLRQEVQALVGCWRGDGAYVLVTFGGGDPGGFTCPVAERLAALGLGGTVLAVVGRGYRGPLPEGRGIELRRAPAGFLERALAASLVVCSASTTSHEMAAMGVLFVPVSTNPHQARIADGWRGLGVSRGG